MTELIDIVKEYDQLEDGKDRQPLEYWEKTYSRTHKSNLVGRKLKSKGLTAVKQHHKFISRPNLENLTAKQTMA
jgi:hypothetical protein